MNAIIAFVVAIVIGRKRPIFSSISGCLLIIAYYLYSNEFEVVEFLKSVWFGCFLSICLSFFFAYIWSGVKGGNHNTGPSYMGGAGGGRGGAPPGGIIQSDEERQRNKRK